jgi:hypothetical protein
MNHIMKFQDDAAPLRIVHFFFCMHFKQGRNRK